MDHEMKEDSAIKTVESLNDDSEMTNSSLLETALKTKSIQAITHGGILEIGNEFTEKRKRLFETEIGAFLDENDQVWRYILEKDCQKIDEVALEKQKELYRNKYNTLQDEINRFYEKSLKDIENNMISETRKSLSHVRLRTISQLNIEHKAILEKEKQRLVREFDRNLKRDTAKFKEMLKSVILKEKEHNELRLMEEERETNEVMKMLKVRLSTSRCATEQLNKHSLSRIENFCNLFSNTSLLEELFSNNFSNPVKNNIPKILNKFEIFIRKFNQNYPEDKQFIVNFEYMVITQMLEIMNEKQT